MSGAPGWARAMGWAVALWRLSAAAAAAATAAASSSSRTLQRLPDGSLPPECSREDVACFPKCCPMGRLLSGSICAHADGAEFDPRVVDAFDDSREEQLLDRKAPYYVVLGHPCPRDEWINLNNNETRLLSSGRLKLHNPDTHETISTIESKYFCLDKWENETETIVCISQDSEDPETIINILYTLGIVSSMLGLLLALLAYLTLLDIHGYTFISHAGCLAVAYIILLVATQAARSGGFSTALCTSVNFAIRFFLLSSFLWVHVMCLDVLWCVLDATGSSRIPYPRTMKWIHDNTENRWATGLNVVEENKDREEEEEESKRRDKKLERRAFLVYSIYVWTLSLLPVIVGLGLKLSSTIPAPYLSHSMELHCELNAEKHEKNFLLFYLYIATFILFNIIIFIYIAIKAVRFNWNTTELHRFPKQKTRIAFLLFVLTSSNWLIDLISWAINGNKDVMKILQGFHIIQGLMTFIIIIFENRVKDGITRKLWRPVTKKCKCCNQTKDEEEGVVLVLHPKCVSSNDESIGFVNPN